MYCLIFLVSALWAVVRSDGPSDVQSLTGRFGENVTLVPPATQLFGEYEIIWSYVQEENITVLIYYDAGEWVKNATVKYQLDEKTGSLTIQSLTANDSRVYQSRIVNEKKLILKGFNLTVVGPSSYSATPTETSAGDTNSTAGPDSTSPTTPPQNWILWIIGVFCVLTVLAILLFAVWKYREPIKERFLGQYMSCDREDPGRSSRQENETQDTSV